MNNASVMYMCPYLSQHCVQQVLKCVSDRCVVRVTNRLVLNNLYTHTHTHTHIFEPYCAFRLLSPAAVITLSCVPLPLRVCVYVCVQMTSRTWKSLYRFGAEKGMRPYTSVYRQAPSAYMSVGRPLKRVFGFIISGARNAGVPLQRSKYSLPVAKIYTRTHTHTHTGDNGVDLSQHLVCRCQQCCLCGV